MTPSQIAGRFEKGEEKMDKFPIVLYANLVIVLVAVMITIRSWMDSLKADNELDRKMNLIFCEWFFVLTIFFAAMGSLIWDTAKRSETHVGPIGLVVVVIITLVIGWKLKLFALSKKKETMSNRERKARLHAILNGEKYIPFDYSETEETPVDDKVYGLDPAKPVLVEKSLFVDESTPATEGWWAGVSSWRNRDFKGSLVQWLRDNGPKSHLIPATKELCESLNLGSPYWNKNIVYGSDGVSLTIWDKKFFFKWEELFFHMKYDLYDYSTVEVSETSITLKLARTFHLLAKDGTEIAWDWSDRSGPLGNFEVKLNFPEKVVSQEEDYTFEYQDGLSGCYGENIPVYYFASDLAEVEKREEDLVLAREAKGRKKS
jgi:hypothetical protein